MSIKEEVVQYWKVALLVALTLGLFANAFTTAEAQTDCATAYDVRSALSGLKGAVENLSDDVESGLSDVSSAISSLQSTIIIWSHD